jgi:stalled ribosome alternative rescue factor ArfA
MARALASRLFAKRVVKSKKVYSRKAKRKGADLAPFSH